LVGDMGDEFFVHSATDIGEIDIFHRTNPSQPTVVSPWPVRR
jgi:hypothetical protein